MLSLFFAALRFLTRCPLPPGWGEATAELARSAPWFPVIGWLIGLVLAALCAALEPHLPAPPLAALLVLALTMVSGAFHLDGLADSADGLLSHRHRERMLEIMRDSRVGSMGVLAIVADLLLKTTALAAMPPDLRWRAIWLAPLAGRGALVLTLAFTRYGRERGLGGLFYEATTPAHALWAIFLACAAGAGLMGTAGLAAAAFALGTALLLAHGAQRVLGGTTGDICGATCETAETTVLLIACAAPTLVGAAP